MERENVLTEDGEEKRVLIEAKNLQRLIRVRGRKVGGKPAYVHAVDGVSFKVYENETLALVGESGCGKSTLGKTILNLVPPTGGELLYKGVDIYGLSPDEMRMMRRNMQIVFQDIGASLNPRHTIEQILMKPIMMFHPELSNDEVRERAKQLLETVGLSPA